MNDDEINELLNIFKQCVDEYMNTLMKIARFSNYKELYHLARKECIGRSLSIFIRHRYPFTTRAKYTAFIHCFHLFMKSHDKEIFKSCVERLVGV